MTSATVAITLYVALASEFLVRYFKNKPIHPADGPNASRKSEESAMGYQDQQDKFGGGTTLTTKVKLMLAGLVFSTLVIFIRCVLSVYGSLCPVTYTLPT